jgi:hypothetical protein
VYHTLSKKASTNYQVIHTPLWINHPPLWITTYIRLDFCHHLWYTVGMKKPKQVIMGIDPGISDPAGWFVDSGTDTSQGLINGHRGALNWYMDFYDLIYLMKPNVLLVCKPAGRFGNVLYSQGKQCGVIQLICEKLEIKYIEKHDSIYRTSEGKRLTKKQVQELSGLENHISDAWMAVEWYKNNN